MDRNQQFDHLNVSDNSSLLGLTLKKSQSFLDLVETKLYPSKLASSHPRKRKRSNVDSSAQAGNAKAKASNISASILRIGSWEKVSKHEGELVTKCYYAKQKLVWEVLESGLKNKIEVLWSDIASLKATCNDYLPETLEIELLRAPLFFREANPQPRKHTVWIATVDFTRGQASTVRRHFLQFPQGILRKHYSNLLQSDNTLSLLSKKPYPSLQSPFFVPENVQNQDPNECKIYGLDWQSSNMQEHSVVGSCDDCLEKFHCFTLSKDAATHNYSKLDQTFASSETSSSRPGGNAGGVGEGTPVTSQNTFLGEFLLTPKSSTASVIESSHPAKERTDEKTAHSLDYSVNVGNTFNLKSVCWTPKDQADQSAAGFSEDIFKSEINRYYFSEFFDNAQVGDGLCTEISSNGAQFQSYISGAESVSVFVLEDQEASSEVGEVVEWNIWT